MRFLGNSGEFFRRGLKFGALFGAMIGLVPGMLLILVLGGGQYGMGLLEVLSFVAMSMAAGAAAGALLGGVMAAILAASRRVLNSLQSKS
jgi:integral membrane sensor domain MASE1